MSVFFKNIDKNGPIGIGNTIKHLKARAIIVDTE
jgi:hypothetical protein